MNGILIAVKSFAYLYLWDWSIVYFFIFVFKLWKICCSKLDEKKMLDCEVLRERDR